MPKVQVYVTNSCGYCAAAKQLLDRKRVSYEVVDVSFDYERRRWLQSASGQRTVPQIFVDERPVGGYTDLVNLDRLGKLDAILGIEPP